MNGNIKFYKWVIIILVLVAAAMIVFLAFGLGRDTKAQSVAGGYITTLHGPTQQTKPTSYFQPTINGDQLQ